MLVLLTIFVWFMHILTLGSCTYLLHSLSHSCCLDSAASRFFFSSLLASASWPFSCFRDLICCCSDAIWDYACMIKCKSIIDRTLRLTDSVGNYFYPWPGHHLSGQLHTDCPSPPSPINYILSFLTIRRGGVGSNWPDPVIFKCMQENFQMRKIRVNISIRCVGQRNEYDELCICRNKKSLLHDCVITYL